MEECEYNNPEWRKNNNPLNQDVNASSSVGGGGVSVWPVLEVPADMERARALNSEQSRGENQAAGGEKLGAMACNVYTGQTPVSLSESDEFFS